MKNNKFWCCYEEVSIVSDEKDCWIFPLGTKSTYIKSLLPIGLKIENNGEISGPFKIKINNNLGLSILWNDKWVNICNLNKDLLSSLLMESTIDNGSIKNEDLEILIDPSDPREVGFVHGDMSDYGVYFNNMCKSMAYDSGKKSKKRKAGHRYDSGDKTMYCVGTVPYHKVGNEYADVGEVTLMCSCKNPKKIKTLGDLVKDLDPIDLELEFEPLRLVDSGLVFEDDIKGNLKPYVDDLLKKSKTIETTLKIMGLGEKSENTDINLITEQVIDTITRNLFSHTGDRLPKHREIQLSDTVEAISSKLELISFPTGYEREILFEYGIDINKLIKDLVQSNPKVDKDFNTYMKYRDDYFRYRLDVGFYNSFQDSNGYIDDVLNKGTKELNNLIKDIANRALLTDGSGVKDFFMIKRGYGSSRFDEYNFNIDLQNILETNPSERIKEDIVKTRFNSIHIKIKKGLEVK